MSAGEFANREMWLTWAELSVVVFAVDAAVVVAFAHCCQRQFGLSQTAWSSSSYKISQRNCKLRGSVQKSIKTTEPLGGAGDGCISSQAKSWHAGSAYRNT